MATTVAATTLNNVYKSITRGTAVSSGSRYLALYSNVAAGTEVTGGDYARVDATTVMTSTPTAGAGANTSTATFASAGPAVTVDGVGVWDASSAGNEIARWPIEGATFLASSVIAFIAGTIEFDVAGG